VNRLRRGLQLVLLLILPVSIGASGNPKTLMYRGGGQGSVAFDHHLHASRGFVCDDCHKRFAATGNALFATQKKALFSMPDHTSGTKCFACHNGKIAFSTCDQCHRR